MNYLQLQTTTDKLNSDFDSYNITGKLNFDFDSYNFQWLNSECNFVILSFVESNAVA